MTSAETRPPADDSPERRSRPSGHQDVDGGVNADVTDDQWRDPDVVFGREPRLSDSGDRRLRDMRSHEPRLRFAWVKIAVMVALLVGLLVFYGQISDKAAGCYQETAGLEKKTQGGAKPEPRSVQPPHTREVQIRIEPAPAPPKAP